VLGKCALCLLQKDLQASHLMPRSLYKKTRSSGPGNQDPIIVKSSGLRRTSHQVKNYVLCRDCEHRFNINGEGYVMTLVTDRNGTFPLLDMLNASTATVKKAEFATYSAGVTPQIDRVKLAFFAISVIWRASIHTWHLQDGETVKLDLGRRYNEEIRQYLMGAIPVPKNAALSVVACTDRDNQNMFFMPSENRAVKDRSVGFMARGIVFRFQISNTVSPPLRRLSIINDSDQQLMTYDCGKHSPYKLTS
jgi:hypothetical protein